jgi:hypothetical protein
MCYIDEIGGSKQRDAYLVHNNITGHYFHFMLSKVQRIYKEGNCRLAKIHLIPSPVIYSPHATCKSLESWRNTLLLNSLELIWVLFISLLHVFGSICQKAGGGSWASWVGGTKYGVWEMLSDVSQFRYMCKHFILVILQALA